MVSLVNDAVAYKELLFSVLILSKCVGTLNFVILIKYSLNGFDYYIFYTCCYIISYKDFIDFF